MTQSSPYMHKETVTNKSSHNHQTPGWKTVAIFSLPQFFTVLQMAGHQYHKDPEQAICFPFVESVALGQEVPFPAAPFHVVKREGKLFSEKDSLKPELLPVWTGTWTWRERPLSPVSMCASIPERNHYVLTWRISALSHRSIQPENRGWEGHHPGNPNRTHSGRKQTRQENLHLFRTGLGHTHSVKYSCRAEMSFCLPQDWKLLIQITNQARGA